MGCLRRYGLAALLALLPFAIIPGGSMASVAPFPLPDPAATGHVKGDPCTPENAYEASQWQETSYGAACQRIHFRYGPLFIQPGEMGANVQPVTIEKPAYSGYIVRFKPDMVDAQTDQVPDITQIHLHHATWLNGYPQYGNGPFFAAGEEKTIAEYPNGYGMHVGATDTWLLLYMVHNQTAQPHVVYITYDVDFVADAAAQRLGIDNLKPLWLDVQKHAISPDAPDRSSYPVFNVQRGFGHVDPITGLHVCTWPKENCSRFDSYTEVTPNQGKAENIAGADWEVTPDMAGTIVILGGHLHPGGVRDEVSLVRNGVEKPIFNSEAFAWSRTDPTTVGGPRNTWDFDMTLTGAQFGWKVKVQAGDIVRLNAVYDNSEASWYENMGIVVAGIATNDTHGTPGIDVFKDNVNIVNGFPFGNYKQPAGMAAKSCQADLVGTTDSSGNLVKTLCLEGAITHPHLREAGTFGGCPPAGCGILDDKPGPAVKEIVASAFTFTNADLGVVGATGIPRVKLGKQVTFLNADTGASIWHTFTLCTESTSVQCDGSTGLDYPLASGGDGLAGDINDFDSGELGYGLAWSSSKGQPNGGNGDGILRVTKNGVEWLYTPTQPGIYQFFCRVHPSMRGVFQVVP